MHRRSVLTYASALILALSGGLPGFASAQTRGSAGSATDLRNVLATGYILQDRNQDDVVDYVHARIILPANASAAEVASAANIAARLGYETSALNLDLVGSDRDGTAAFDQPVILVGSQNTLAPRATAERSLSAGQGAISFIRADPMFRAGAILLEGGDASGLLAAAGYFAGRYPSIWSLRGAVYADLPDRIARFLTQDGILAQAALERIVVDADRQGVSRALVSVQVPDSAYARAIAVLERADSALRDTAAARRGGARDSTAARVQSHELQFTDLHRLDLRVAAGARRGMVSLLPTTPWQTRAGNEFTYRESPDFTLSDLFTIRGLFRDTNQDLVPDRTDAYLSVHGGDAPRGLVELAARIGLETAGMRLPFARVDGQDDYPQQAGFPILFGVGHYQVERLRRAGKLHTDALAQGDGFMEFVSRGLDRRNGIVLSGGDPAGLRAITDYVARRMPYLWEYGKGNYELRDLETDVRRFFQVKDAPGQIALAVYKARAWLDRLKGKSIDSVAIELAAREAPANLDAFLARQVQQRFPGARASAQVVKTGFGVGKPIFEEEIDLPWEVDEFRKLFNAEALPRLNANSRGRIEVRVSEAPEVRAELEREIESALRAKGIAADAYDVVVLSAYKQGYSWLYDQVLPRLRGQPVGRIEISYHNLKDSKEVRWQEIESDTRWLQEIYPVDAVLAKQLGIADSLITFTPTQVARPVYTVRVLDRGGAELLRESFDPKYVIRPFFDLFPEYESVRVTTGWVTVIANGDTVLDRRIRTDPEAFWDHFQQKTYARIIEYVMDVQDGRPAPTNAPYFDELRVDLTLSEPNYRIGIDEEVVSSAEALHEDIYFETLTLFSLLGNRYDVGSLDFIGRVLPHITPPVHGKPGRARIVLTGKERAEPELIMTWRERGQEPVSQRYALAALPVDAPKLRGMAVRAGGQRVERALFEVVALDSVDRYDEHKGRGSEGQIDRMFLPAPTLSGMVGIMGELHTAGILEDALSYDRIGELKFRFALRDTLAAWQSSKALRQSRRSRSTRNPVLHDSSFAYRGQRIVQWQTPIPPAESDSVLARLATFPTVNVYYLAKSFLGQNIFAADFLPPSESKYVSQAKLNALKPTLFLSGRQHANEVSSTSHILRLGELLATDSTYTRLLRRANVVLHPITNPDGARLAYEMQKVNPDFMLHAGYLGALGVDATSGANTPDPIYPESLVRPELMETWLPDIYVNMHGYPSHEWVQYFAGYSAWVRSRRGAQRSWWAPRGWFIPGFNWVDDARYPELKKAQFAVLDSIAQSITGVPAVQAMNQRMYARYQKYGRQDVENFREYFHNGILVSLALRGREATGQGVNNPRVNYISITTEAPDETARGAWLELVASAGLAHSSALLRYLANGTNEIKRESSEYDQFVIRSVFRKKPVLPKEPKATNSP